MIMKASPPYPFPVSPHTIWILRQLLDTPRKWNLGDEEYFILKSFNVEHEPSIENDYYTNEILLYLKNRKVIQVITGDRKGMKEYELPLPDKPIHTMVAEWEVRILNRYLIVKLLENVVYQARIKSANKQDRWHCHFEIDDDNILWMKTELGNYPLRQLNHGLISYKVMRTLCENGVVELLDDGSIKSGKYSGTKVKSLQEVLRGVGFDRMLKKSFFEESSTKRIALKNPAPAFGRSFHEAIIDIFEESSRIRNTLNNSKRKIADFPRYDL
jgi:hypothetical protein